MDESDYFRAALEFYLKERKSQSNLASTSDTSEGYISQLLSGKRDNISRPKSRKIASALGTTYFDMLVLGKSILENDSPNRVSEQYKPYAVSTPVTVDKYSVIAEVGEILDSGNVDIIDALVKNVREFRRAVDTSKRLNVYEEELKELREEVSDLRKQVSSLTAPPIGADVLVASSGKGGT